MRRVVQCDYRDLRTGETWTRLFAFDAKTGERTDPAILDIEKAPLPDRKRQFWRGMPR